MGGARKAVGRVPVYGSIPSRGCRRETEWQSFALERIVGADGCRTLRRRSLRVCDEVDRSTNAAHV